MLPSTKKEKRVFLHRIRILFHSKMLLRQNYEVSVCIIDKSNVPSRGTNTFKYLVGYVPIFSFFFDRVSLMMYWSYIIFPSTSRSRKDNVRHVVLISNIVYKMFGNWNIDNVVITLIYPDNDVIYNFLNHNLWKWTVKRRAKFNVIPMIIKCLLETLVTWQCY